MNLVLGTANFGQKYGIANQGKEISFKEAASIIDFAISKNVTFIDTASTYGDAESMLGEIGMANFKIITKIRSKGELGESISSWLTREIELSLERLKINSLHGALFHRSDDVDRQHIDEITTTLEKLRSAGLVQNIGVSIYDPSELSSPHWLSFPLDIIQAPLNLIDRRIINSNFFAKLKNNHTEIHVRSVFLQGLLLMPKEKRPNWARSWTKIWDEWEKWLDENKSTSALSACLQFSKSFDAINKVVVGASSLKEFKHILSTMENEHYIKFFPKIESIDKRLIDPFNWKSNEDSCNYSS